MVSVNDYDAFNGRCDDAHHDRWMAVDRHDRTLAQTRQRMNLRTSVSIGSNPPDFAIAGPDVSPRSAGVPRHRCQVGEHQVGLRGGFLDRLVLLRIAQHQTAFTDDERGLTLWMEISVKQLVRARPDQFDLLARVCSVQSAQVGLRAEDDGGLAIRIDSDAIESEILVGQTDALPQFDRRGRKDTW